MTTLVYQKWKSLSSDRRWTGGEAGYIDTCQKLFSYKKEEYNVHLAVSWHLMMEDVMVALLTKYFSEWFDAMKLFDLQEEFTRINFSKTYDYILVFEDIKNLTDRWFHINNTMIEEIHYHYCTVWSGSYLVDWILLRDPSISIGELFKLVASKDINTSEEFKTILLSLDVPF